MIKRRDKRGEILSSQVIALAIGVLVLLAAGLAVWQFYKKGQEVTNLAPTERDLLVSACNDLYSASRTTLAMQQFCKTFRETKTSSGNKVWVNCQYAPIYNVLDPNTKLSDKECGGNSDANAKAWCQRWKDEKFKSYGEEFVNGKTCVEWGVSEDPEEVVVASINGDWSELDVNQKKTACSEDAVIYDEHEDECNDLGVMKSPSNDA